MFLRLALCACLTVPSWAGLLTVANHSFETAAIGTIGGVSGVVTSWTAGGSGSSANLRPSAAQLSGGPADGLQVLQVTDGSRFQTLTDVLTANTLYTLTVAVGKPSDLTMRSYVFTLEAGSTVIATASAPPNSIPANGDMDDVSISYSALAGDALLGQALTIRLSHTNAGGDALALYDNVRLDATAIDPSAVPEPASALLLLAGLAAACLGRRYAG
ncbi:MAG: PEP-CTERM sorting domain-containing protein [Acidobacteria bacterium]|nr:PEP-CTERM sorting domain-containing protein [Acidobacteriota bacterium]